LDQETDLKAQDELLSETLTGAELREVLERLGSVEFALNDNSSIRDLVEGTGASPVAIGRALAEVRKQDFQERFAVAFGNHEKRIQTLETSAANGVGRASSHSEDYRRKAPLTTKERQFVQGLWRLTGVLAIIALAALVFQSWFDSLDDIKVTGRGGVTITKSRAGKYSVTEKSGTSRVATEDEMALFDREEARVRHWNRPIRGAPPPPTSP
jgi:hypothetical protein